MALMTRLRLVVRTSVLALALIGPAATVSCSGESAKTGAPAAGAGNAAGGSSHGGSGGTGGSSGGTSGTGGDNGAAGEAPQPIECGAMTCDPKTLPDLFMQPPIPACCTADDQCGLDSSRLADYGIGFSEVCQARDQPGNLDTSCPSSPPLMIPNVDLGGLTLTVPGCCRQETGTCGYYMKIASIIDLGLGCVDSTPFLEGGAAQACEPK